MNKFDEKEKSQEAKFAKDQELKFKFISRRNKLFGQWAATQMKKNNEEVENYSRQIISLYIDNPVDQNIIEKVSADLKTNNIKISQEDINKKFEECFDTAREQITNR